MRRVKWGVLGCSSFARRRGIPAMLQAQSVHLQAAASRTLEKAQSFCSQFHLDRAYGSYHDLLADTEIEAVHITTVNGLHAEWMLHALLAGKHVLCEKPFTMTLCQAEEVAAAARRAGLQIAEGLVWRFHPQHLRAMEEIKKGTIGNVYLIRAAFSFQLQDRTIRCDPDLGGGSMLDVGGYPISAARLYFGCEPARVDARGVMDKQGVDMNMAGMLEFPQGTALVDCSFDAPYRTDLEIVADKGRIYFPRAWQPPEEAVIYINDETVTLPAANQYAQMFEQFSRAILNKQSTLYGIDDAVAQMKVVQAVKQSIHSGRPELI